MSGHQESISTLLEERPEMEDDLRAILEVDANRERWSFGDIPVDSGSFGELVDQDVIESIGEDYRVADREALIAALEEDELEPESTDKTKSIPSPTVLSRIRSIDTQFAALFGLVSGIFLLFRLFPVLSVFRRNDVVLSANDPYFYRYWVSQVVAGSSGPLDLRALTELPGGVLRGEPLLVSSLGFAAELFGGPPAIGHVLAWYPVVLGFVTGVLVYFTAKDTFRDRRVGLAAMGLLAVTPGHALRTGLGFADHHAFDYLWLTLTALALVALDDAELGDRRTWLFVTALGVGTAGQILAWEAGPLLLLPGGIYVGFRVISEVRADRSPVQSTSPIVVGLLGGALLTYGAHHFLGWHTDAVTATPMLMFMVAGTALLGGELAHRGDVNTGPFTAFGGISAAVFLWAAITIVPSLGRAFDRGVTFLVRTEGIAEAQSLFEQASGGIVSPLLLFGFVLPLALPYVAWSGWKSYRSHNPRLLVLIVYTCYFIVLTMLQIRFAGQLSMFLAVFAGLGLVHLGSWVELMEGPRVFDNRRTEGSKNTAIEDEVENSRIDFERRQVISSSSLFVGVSSLGTIMTPLKHNQIVTREEKYKAAKWMAAYSDRNGLSYPENYVLSEWSRNRMYNYFVNGESKSYTFARDTYQSFVNSESPDGWYEQLAGRVGFIVVEPSPAPPDTLIARFNRYSSGTRDAPGLGQFRALYAGEDEDLKVLMPVPGATIEGIDPGAEPRTVSTDVAIDGAEFTYQRSVEPDDFGAYQVTLAYPGEYEVPNETVTVTTSDIMDGRTYEQYPAEGIVYWSFDEGRGDTAHDRAGGHHLEGIEGMWGDGAVGSAIHFGTGDRRLSTDPGEFRIGGRESLTISFFLRGDLEPPSGNTVEVVRTSVDGNGFGFWSRKSLDDFGVRFEDTSGTKVRNFGIQDIGFADWTHVAAVLDREAGELRLHRNGELVETTPISNLDTLGTGGVLRLGPSADHNPFSLDEFRLYQRALSPNEIRREASTHLSEGES